MRHAPADPPSAHSEPGDPFADARLSCTDGIVTSPGVSDFVITITT
jgi:hypothetical protein